MKEVYYNDTPLRSEIGRPLRGEAFAGEYEPVTLSLVPLADLGRVTVTAGDMIGPAGVIPAGAIDVGFVSYRVARVTMEGSVYTIKPRFIMPMGTVAMPKGTTRRFWLTVKTPATARPGVYQGRLAVRAENGGTADVPIEFRVRAGTLDPVDIPAGPYSYTINIPWYGDDPKTARYNRQASLKSLKKIREYGFTSCSGFPHIAYQGFKDGKPLLDFTAADAEMRLAKKLQVPRRQHLRRRSLRIRRLLPGPGRDGQCRVQGLFAFLGPCTGKSRSMPRPRTGSQSTITWATSRWAMT